MNGEVKRHKATVKFVERNWIKLQNLAAMQNTSATAILNNLVEAYVDDKLPENYEERIQTEVYRVLDSKIEDSLIEAIAQRVQEKLGGTVQIDLPNDEIEAEVAYSTADTDNTVNTANTDDTDSTSDTDSTDGTVNTDSTDIISRLNANLAKFKRYKVTDRSKGHKDRYVAEKEGLSTYTITRYRKGQRSPSAEFIARWGLNWNGSEWLENKA